MLAVVFGLLWFVSLLVIVFLYLLIANVQTLADAEFADYEVKAKQSAEIWRQLREGEVDLSDFKDNLGPLKFHFPPIFSPLNKLRRRLTDWMYVPIIAYAVLTLGVEATSGFEVTIISLVFLVGLLLLLYFIAPGLDLPSIRRIALRLVE